MFPNCATGDWKLGEKMVKKMLKSVEKTKLVKTQGKTQPKLLVGFPPSIRDSGIVAVLVFLGDDAAVPHFLLGSGGTKTS